MKKYHLVPSNAIAIYKGREYRLEHEGSITDMRYYLCSGLPEPGFEQMGILQRYRKFIKLDELSAVLAKTTKALYHGDWFDGHQFPENGDTMRLTSESCEIVEKHNMRRMDFRDWSAYLNVKTEDITQIVKSYVPLDKHTFQPIDEEE